MASHLVAHWSWEAATKVVVEMAAVARSTVAEALTAEALESPGSEESGRVRTDDYPSSTLVFSIFSSLFFVFCFFKGRDFLCISVRVLVCVSEC